MEKRNQTTRTVKIGRSPSVENIKKYQQQHCRYENRNVKRVIMFATEMKTSSGIQGRIIIAGEKKIQKEDKGELLEKRKRV